MEAASWSDLPHSNITMHSSFHPVSPELFGSPTAGIGSLARDKSAGIHPSTAASPHLNAQGRLAEAGPLGKYS